MADRDAAGDQHLVHLLLEDNINFGATYPV
jgi:hypothetical protein